MIKEQIYSWIEKRKFGLAWLAISLILVGLGVFWWKTYEDMGTKIEVISGPEVKRSLMVDVGGSVNKPGVYALENGARIEQALAMAGGLRPDADADWVASVLNQAAKVTDGEKIYIPKKDDVKSQVVIDSHKLSQNKINLNTASQVELESLPGVGPVTAGKIVAARPYSDISELKTKKIVGDKGYEQIKDLVELW